MMALLLPYATPGLSHIAGWCVRGAPLRGQPRTPAMMWPHRCEGLRVRRNDGVAGVPRTLHGAPSAPPIIAQRVARCDHNRAHNCLPPLKLDREIQ
jgi:hypothetical protein